MKQRGWGIPLLLGLATFALLALVLWPEEEPTQTVVVAARDLGAGTALQASDLTLLTMPAAQAPADAVADAQVLVGQTLTVVRFAGEPVTLRHLGEAVTLGPDERGIAVKVSADTGLAGLLRPGMAVGLVATLPAGTNDLYAKAMLEGLRVLYVPPDFQARPYAPITAQMNVTNGETDSYQAAPPPAEPVEDGVLVLAASTQPITITYTLDKPESTAAPAEIVEGAEPAPEATDAEPPPARRIVPVELLAALNAANAAFTLVLTPEQRQDYTTAGLSVASLTLTADEQAAQGEVTP